jgi:hypothetical protein
MGEQWHDVDPRAEEDAALEALGDDTPLLIAYLDYRAYEAHGETDEAGGYVRRVSLGHVRQNSEYDQRWFGAPRYEFCDARGSVQALTYAWQVFEVSPPDAIPAEWERWHLEPEHCSGPLEEKA